ncbi:MAG: ATP-binding protein [bacterium]|nr:ATP-binding protein [bacterium]
MNNFFDPRGLVVPGPYSNLKNLASQAQSTCLLQVYSPSSCLFSISVLGSQKFPDNSLIGFRCSKNTISNYLSYMESSFFLYQALFYSNNVKDQMQYPRKVYFIDNGFLKYLALNPDRSRSFENLVAIELKRRGYKLFYWKNLKGEEVDFVIIENETVLQLIQVCYNMTLEDTREREIRSLKKAMQHFGLGQGTILTLNQEETIIENGFEITVIPASKWLLEP